MKNLFKLCTILLCFLMVTGCSNDQQKIERIVKNLNKQCPITFGSGDNEISFLSAEAMPNNCIKLNIKANSMIDTESEKQLFTEAIKTVFIALINYNNKEFKELKDIQATVIVAVNTGNELFEVKITPEDYSNDSDTKSKSERNNLNDEEMILSSIAEQTKKQLPVVDENTGIKTIDCYTDKMTLVYVYELPHTLPSDVDSQTFVNTIKPLLIQALKNNLTLRLEVKKGATIKYIYKIADGSIFAEMEINLTDLD